MTEDNNLLCDYIASLRREVTDLRAILKEAAEALNKDANMYDKHIVIVKINNTLKAGDSSGDT